MRREITEKDKLYENVWNCAYRRYYLYRDKNPKRAEREWTTVQMCLKIAKWIRWAGE